MSGQGIDMMANMALGNVTSAPGGDVKKKKHIPDHPHNTQQVLNEGVSDKQKLYTAGGDRNIRRRLLLLVHLAVQKLTAVPNS